MRRLAASLLVAALVGALVAGGGPAHAETLPPNLDPIYDLPSTWPGGTLTDEEALLRKHEIDLARQQANAKWYTAAVDLGSWKGLGKAAGSTLGGFLLGFDVGANGVGAVALVTTVASGEVPTWWCNTPDWYTGATIAGGFGGLGSTCPGATVPYLEPNADAPPGAWSGISYGGYVAAYKGALTSQWCYSVSGSVPVGYTLQGNTASGWVSVGPFSHSPCSTLGGTRAVSIGAPVTSPGLRVIQTSDPSNVVAQMTQASGDPVRYTRCGYHFAVAATKYSEWVSYRDSTGFPASQLGLACDAVGSTLTDDEILTLRSVGIEEKQDGGAITEIAESEVPTEMQQYQEDHGLGRKALILVKTLETGAEISCLAEGELCRNWWEDTDEGTSTTSPYRCTYGGATVDLAECAPYKYSFQLGTTPGTITDPQTGEEIPWGSTNPNSLDPSSGPTPGETCMASWGSAPNPVEWVFWPVKCALVWAFVPRQATVDSAATAADAKWRASTPGQLAASVAGVTAAVELLDAGNCGGIILAVPKVGAGWSVVTENRAFLAACPGDFFAPWAPVFYWFITAALGLAGVVAIKRLLDRFVGNA